MGNANKYWFPAKRYGWGWGAPLTWQGWLAMLLYFATITALAIVFLPEERPVPFFLGFGLATIILLAVCWMKGEPPRWRWGGK